MALNADDGSSPKSYAGPLAGAFVKGEHSRRLRAGLSVHGCLCTTANDPTKMSKWVDTVEKVFLGGPNNFCRAAGAVVRK
jgi:hypothetical protein